MDWKDVTEAISKYAPGAQTLLTAASLIPGVGVVTGPAAVVIGALGKALGTDPTPDAIVQAITTDPAAALKLKQAELDYELSMEREETARLRSTNETMQAESRSEHWPQYSWRPFWGFVSGTAFCAVCILVCMLAWRAISKSDAVALSNIPLIIGAFATLFSIPGAILGIASWKRGTMKIEQIKNQ